MAPTQPLGYLHSLVRRKCYEDRAAGMPEPKRDALFFDIDDDLDFGVDFDGLADLPCVVVTDADARHAHGDTVVEKDLGERFAHNRTDSEAIHRLRCVLA